MGGVCPEALRSFVANGFEERPFELAGIIAAARINHLQNRIAMLSAGASASANPAEWFDNAVLAVERQNLVMAEFYRRVIQVCRSEHELWYPQGPL